MKYKKFNEEPIFTGEKVLCEHCGWLKRFHYRGTERLICNNCKRWIYINDEAKLKYKNKEAINKLKQMIFF